MSKDPLMATVGNAGGTRSLDHNGKTYTFHQWTDELRSRYTDWAKKFAVAELRKLRDTGVFNLQEYTQAFNDLRRDIMNGEYDFGGSCLHRMIGTHVGSHVLIRVLLNDPYLQDEEITELMTHRLEEIDLIIAELEGRAEGGAKPDETPPKG